MTEVKNREVFKMHYLFLYNPFSGRQTIAEAVPQMVLQVQASGSHLETFALYADGNDETAIRNRLQDTQSYDCILIAGGDGTLSFVMGMMVELGIHVPVGLLPCGTCNDFSSVLPLGRTWREQLQTILRGETIPVDMVTWQAGGKRKYWICDYEFGGFSAVSYATPPQIKKRLGRIAYYFEVIRHIWFLRPFPVTLCADGNVTETQSLIVLMLNGSRFAGIQHLLPGASVSDGLMDVAVLHPCPLYHALVLLWNLFSGRADQELFVELLQCRTLELVGPEDVDTTVDGERGDPLPLKFEVLKGCLNILAPTKEMIP